MKRPNKQDRERKVLLGLVEYYIQTGKPVGSHSLKEEGFEDLSSATIRNYFASLEEEGYVTQSHSSSGRVPTYLAYQLYAEYYKEQHFAIDEEIFRSLRQFDTREIASFLQEAAELLSRITQCAVCLSAPRFDHDFIIEIKLVPLNAFRCLCVLITDFGVVQTEVLQLPSVLTEAGIKRIENYFQGRLKGGGVQRETLHLKMEEKAIGQSLYHELMLRYLVGYSTFIHEDIYRTGFSHLLGYPDFQEANALVQALALFENVTSMRKLLKECRIIENLKFWIGKDLLDYTVVKDEPNYAVLSIPYYINRKSAGAVSLLGPMRLPYRVLFSVLRCFSECLSEALTRSVYKFKINFREPEMGQIYLQKEEHRLIGQSRLILLEDNRKDKY
jgi:heat-inducible transcriptional repressor